MEITKKTKIFFIGAVWTQFGDNPKLMDDIIMIKPNRITSEGILQLIINEEFEKLDEGTQVIMYIRIHGLPTDNDLTFDNKLFISYKEISEPIILHRKRGLTFYGILQSCYTGKNETLTKSFDMSVGSTNIVLGNPMRSETMVIDFFTKFKNYQLSDHFENDFANKYCKMGNSITDCFGHIKDDEPEPWKLYKRS